MENPSCGSSHLTPTFLREILNYDPVTGVFTWATSRGCCSAGDDAGTQTDKGYRFIKIEGKKYAAHRLAILYVEGVLPKDPLMVDHINGEKSDNRYDNLRVVSRRVNALNSKTNSNNKAGTSNVRQLPDTKRWQVRFSNKSYGCYNSKKEALSVADTLREALIANEL